MTATSHALIGTAIAATFANPVIGIPLALLSHIAADAVPHWDTATHRKDKTRKRLLIESASDVALGFVLSFLLIHFFFPKTNLTYAFFAIIAAQALDWLTAPYLFFKSKIKLFTLAYKFQKLFDNRLCEPWGVVTQVAVVGCVILLARLF